MVLQYVLYSSRSLAQYYQWPLFAHRRSICSPCGPMWYFKIEKYFLLHVLHSLNFKVTFINSLFSAIPSQICKLLVDFTYLILCKNKIKQKNKTFKSILVQQKALQCGQRKGMMGSGQEQDYNMWSKHVFIYHWQRINHVKNWELVKDKSDEMKK